ncbi:MAG TPA: ABC transporter permease [Gemmatimonadaceae bacterium]|nr:ABC transporter permease [Gemmatimonadaceae bacterium]
MSWWSRFRNQSRSDDLSRDVDREMRFHLAEREDDLVRLGMAPADARREARRRFGNVTFHMEATRERDLFVWLDTLLRDLRYALRSLRGAPVFAVVAVLSLALGIGVNTAIFSIIDAVMLKSLPVTHPEELVKLVRDTDDDEFTNPLWEAIRDRQDVFSGVFAFGSTGFNLAAGGEARHVRANWVSGDYFATLGVRAEIGRTVLRGDDYRGCPGAVVLSDGFWHSEYGGDERAIGKTISLDGHPFPIVGVADPRFFGVSVGDRPQVFVPICAEDILAGADSFLDQRGVWLLQIVARPKAGLTMAQVNARLATLGPAINEATLPKNWPTDAIADYSRASLLAESAANGFSELRGTYKKALYILMTIVGLVLAVACANVANLLLARAAAREREMAVRLALGASRARLARQLITESLLLSILGAAFGSAFAVWGSKVLVSMLSQSGRSVMLDLEPDRTVLLFTIAVATATGLLFGVVPAWRAGRVDPQAAMKARGRGVAEGHSRFRIGRALVAAQVGLSLVLIAGAGLLIGSWRTLATLDPGFRREGILIVGANIHATNTPTDQRAALFARMLARLRTIPGVQSASMSDLTPVGPAAWNGRLDVAGFTPKSRRDDLAWMNAVSDGYFSTLAIPVLRGRDFDARDGVSGPKAVIVSEAMARRFFGTADAVGKRFRVEDGPGFSPPIEIVGVVGDTKYRSLRDTAPPIVYYPQAQQDAKREGREFELRMDVGSPALLANIKAAIAEFSPKISLDIHTLDAQLSASTALSRTIAMLSGFFGALALLLASVGLYGIMAYTVARRRNEIGVRIALGAEYGRVVRMVLGEVGRIVLAGVAVGLLLSFAVMRLVNAFLYGVRPTDAFTLAMSALVLLAVGIGAAALPARRAARLDPVAALREE